ncbi:MAG: HDOD domain-containing protein [Actinomycetota bacterium]
MSSNTAARAAHLRAVPAAAPARPVTSGALAAAAERLASPSPVVAGVLELLDDPSTPVRLIAARIAQSPELAARVLKLANSAHFSEPVVTLERAVVRIGERPLRGLLLAATTYRLLEGSLDCYRLPRMALLRHSGETASMAQTVARRLSAALAPQAYLAGLLHDLGKPIIADAVGAFGGDTPDAGTLTWERRLFGTDHARVAAWIGRNWSLPEELCCAIEAHHARSAPERPLDRIVWLADVLVHAAHGEPSALARVRDAAEECELPLDAVEQILSATPEGEAPRKPPGLTDREVQVLRLLASGATAKQVATRLGCSASTVHNHLHHIYSKLNVTGQAQALLLAREHGWV